MKKLLKWHLLLVITSCSDFTESLPNGLKLVHEGQNHTFLLKKGWARGFLDADIKEVIKRRDSLIFVQEINELLVKRNLETYSEHGIDYHCEVAEGGCMKKCTDIESQLRYEKSIWVFVKQSECLYGPFECTSENLRKFRIELE